jgi:hypothetical protein
LEGGNMQIIECPHCGHENWVSDLGEEEAICELCDNYLDEVPDDDEEEEVE